MYFLEKLKSFLVSVIAFPGICPRLGMPRSQPPPPPSIVDPESHQPPTLPLPPTSASDPETLQPESPSSAINVESFWPPAQSSAPSPSTNDLETLQPESPSSAINVESSWPPTQSSAPSPSTNDFETLQPESPSSAINVESSRLPSLPSPPSPSTNDLETLQPESTPPATPTTPSNLNQLETILAAQQHLQLKSSVLSFCFSYPLAVSLQYAQTNHHQVNYPDSSFILLSFLVLLTFNLILVALFIRPSCTKTSEVLEKVAFLVAAAAFCHATAIPFPFELKCTVLIVFLHSLLLITINKYFNRSFA